MEAHDAGRELRLVRERGLAGHLIYEEEISRPTL